MLLILRHLRYRPSLLVGLGVAVLAAGAAASLSLRATTAVLIGWDLGVVAYAAMFLVLIRHATPDSLRRISALLDEGRWGVLAVTVIAALASLGAIVAELAQVHGRPHAGWTEGLAGATVVLSWFFIHLIFTTHYAHEFWRDGSGLSFPGNDRPTYSEFLYFSFCIAVASQVSDVSTQSASMRQLVLAHSMVAYLFNTAVIALGVNIAASSRADWPAVLRLVRRAVCAAATAGAGGGCVKTQDRNEIGEKLSPARCPVALNAGFSLSPTPVPPKPEARRA